MHSMCTLLGVWKFPSTQTLDPSTAYTFGCMEISKHANTWPKHGLHFWVYGNFQACKHLTQARPTLLGVWKFPCMQTLDLSTAYTFGCMEISKHANTTAYNFGCMEISKHANTAYTFGCMEISKHANTAAYNFGCMEISKHANTAYTFGCMEISKHANTWPKHGLHFWVYGNFQACKHLTQARPTLLGVWKFPCMQTLRHTILGVWKFPSMQTRHTLLGVWKFPSMQIRHTLLGVWKFPSMQTRHTLLGVWKFPSMQIWPTLLGVWKFPCMQTLDLSTAYSYSMESWVHGNFYAQHAPLGEWKFSTLDLNMAYTWNFHVYKHLPSILPVQCTSGSGSVSADRSANNCWGRLAGWCSASAWWGKLLMASNSSLNGQVVEVALASADAVISSMNVYHHSTAASSMLDNKYFGICRLRWGKSSFSLFLRRTSGIPLGLSYNHTIILRTAQHGENG